MFEEKIGDEVFEVSHKYTEHTEAGRYYSHMHNYCELLLFISGDADYVIDGQTYNMRPYYLLTIPQAVYHCLTPKSDVPYENYVINFSASMLTEAQYGALFSPPCVSDIENDAELRLMFSQLDTFRSVCSAEDFRSAALNLIKNILIYCSYKEAKSSEPMPRCALVEEILGYIAGNIEKPLSAAVLSERLYVSKSYIQNLFSRVMHIGLKEYIVRKKVLSAHEDIKNGMSPGKAAEKYSFSDYSGFYRLYKKTFGASPKKR